MDTPRTLELTVDLGLWQEGAEVMVEVPAAVTVGHVADQLALFVGLPTHDEDEKRLPYTLRPAADPSMLDRELAVLSARISGPVALAASSVPPVDQLLSAYEQKIKDAIDAEVEQWLEKGRKLVLGALSDAMNEIRDDLRERIAPLVPSGIRGVIAQYKAGRALRKFGRVRAETAYTDAVRSGLRLAGKSAGSVLGFAGNTAASAAAGGLAGTAAGTAAGATAGVVAATTIIVIGNGIGLFGTDGAAGPPGRDGNDGLQGEPGAMGETGPIGERGEQGEPGTVWSVGLAAPSDDTDGDFHLDRCTGVISHNGDDGWVEIVDLAATQGRAVASACDNLEIVAPGQSLWAVVSRRCRDDSGGRLTNSEIARAVAQTWVANLDIVGPTADAIDTNQPLVLRCS